MLGTTPLREAGRCLRASSLPPKIVIRAGNTA